MATTTPNFGWPVPTSTDLVKDGATAIEALGDSIDASLLDLKGGTTGQVLSKNSNTDMDFTWVTDAAGDITGVTAGTGISGGGTSGTVTVTNSMATAIDAKGDLVVGTGSDTFSRLAVGTNNYVLTADSAEATGIKWAAPGGGALVKITSNSFSAQSSVAIDGCFTSTYTKYFVIWEAISSVSDADLQLQFRYAGPTTQTSTASGSGFGYVRGNTVNTWGYVSQAQNTIIPSLSSATSFGNITFDNVGNSSQQPCFFGQGFGDSFQAVNQYSGYNDTARTYTGFLLKPDSGTITGTYAVYGLEN